MSPSALIKNDRALLICQFIEACGVFFRNDPSGNSSQVDERQLSLTSVEVTDGNRTRVIGYRAHET